MLSKRDMDPLHGTDRAPAEGLLRALFGRYIEYHGEPDQWDDDGGWCQKHAPTVAEVRAALRSEGHVYDDPSRWGERFDQPESESDSGLDALAEAVSDSLAATTEGTDYAEAPEPSDEPGSPYVLRLTNELAARGVARLSTPRTT